MYFDHHHFLEYCFYYFFKLYYCAIFYSLYVGFFFFNTIRVSNSLDPDQTQHFCWAWSGSKLFAKVISRQQISPLVCKALNRKQLLAKILAKVNFICILIIIIFWNIAFIISSNFIIVPYFTLCMLDFFFQYHQGVKQFGSRSDPTFLLGLIWVQTVCKGYQQTTNFTPSVQSVK